MAEVAAPGGAASAATAKSAPKPAELPQLPFSWPAARKMLLGPSAAAVAAFILGQAPARPIEVHIHLDLRAAVLLVVCACVMGMSWASMLKPTVQESATAEPAPEVEVKSAATAPLPSPEKGPGLDFEGLDIPDELLRVLVAWRPEGARVTGGEQQQLQCPVCHSPMLRAKQTSCQHHACARCLERLHADGTRACPRCSASADLQALVPPAKEMVESLGARACTCTACQAWSGTWADFCMHVLSCAAAQGVVAVRSYRLGAEAEERRRRAALTASIDALYADMAGASPALVHRIPAHALESPDVHWSSPPFSACGRPWSIRIGPLGTAGASGSRYFCLLPHAHGDRLRCSFFFAKKAYDGFKERRVHDWPPELAGHPWGPTVPGEELAQYKQADGSMLFMVHAVGLGTESEIPAAEATSQGHT